MAAGIAILFYYNKKKSGDLSRSQWTIKEIAVAALCIALAFVLSYIRLWKMPNGGSITAEMCIRDRLFRGEPAISGFDWNFTAIHRSSPVIATNVRSVLHGVLPPLQPAHG